MYFSLNLKRAHDLQRPRLPMTSLFGIIQLNFNSVAAAIIISVCKFMRLVFLTCQTSMPREAKYGYFE